MIERAHPFRRLFVPFLVLASAAGCDGADSGEPDGVPDVRLTYPESPRADQRDEYFGESVQDPYRWMEDLDSPEVAAWVEAQNELAQPYLEGIDARERFKRRLTELWDYERFTTPFREGDRYFYFRNDGLQDQNVLYVTESLDREGRVLIDPNGFSQDATVALAGLSVSPDGRYVAYARSDGGSDWRTWHVRDVAGGQDLVDFIDFTKFTDVSWDRDASGFYYSRYPVGADGRGDGQAQVSVFHHALETPQDQDREVFALPDQPRWNPYASVSEDGRYLVITVSEGFSENALYYRDLRGGGPVVRLLDEWDALYTFVGNDGPRFFIQTNKDAPRWRVVAIDVRRPGTWTDVIPEADETLQAASYVGGRFAAHYLVDARSEIRILDGDGAPVRTVGLPGIGSVSGFGGHADDSETFYSFTSFTNPGEVHRYDVETGDDELWKRVAVDFDPNAFETTQVFYESADGTRVSMFITHRRGLVLSGENPTLLYGYGGFNISLTPAFDVGRLVWMEAGGVLAIPNLRGGGEYGEAWHEAGTKLRKQNVFDDFIAAAEWLMNQGYTYPARLAIQGGSNGGLLVGASLIQRPELFGAALPAVGVLDMLRYHTASLNARSWSSDYGLSENADEYRALRAYSPVHNVQDGVCHPATLITTADHDDRVVPWHSFKFGASLQHAQGCDRPILVRVETRAGHGAGKPTWMRIEEIADAWAFLHRHLRMEGM
jgi:prolyl oligopeptidase